MMVTVTIPGTIRVAMVAVGMPVPAVRGPVVIPPAMVQTGAMPMVAAVMPVSEMFVMLFLIAFMIFVTTTVMIPPSLAIRPCRTGK